ncbi:ABC transporter ATP-binding protein [Ornithobacterium rhinotracheale]|uniref:ATPase component of various ABC-type transport systems with duplicated ATPase domain n=2 Tax=Ornithobacterium rhinotracheale TaxID=28251 RepID=I3ZZY3_ORNRL|nr:ABC transporter ATP-binding protein [Ornithobacterium rhinotracheale]AFL97267.1 ATPase component of various ABC-type transport systems with duplicated ATPase domain [Ornithobacterium rhinotracheale DSM 15997]AIP99331.1 ABC transporter ATP-binding protein [Ornithobacterium rhinotracheale ORT-UMN 88]KGB66439.1 ABC transporter ATP-binding protein [Ornithobacterium rhinotracheale H06-030791]MCK0194159.1 ABC transporter ATP-binding protein [Ornithobacterium rhinotracheale]UOH64317.1 ABC transpor
MQQASESLLKVENLSISFGDKKVVNNLSFTLSAGEILGIVGESGSGKSLTSLAIMHLLPKYARTEGKILFTTERETYDLLAKNHTSLKGKNMGMIFQEPMTSLNPSLRCGDQVMENLLLHQKISKKDAKQKVLSLFEEVELPSPERIFKAYPHELSGGQKQRVMIALALICEPQLLIADEPTTALDVTVQKAILQLLKKLQKNYKMGIIFISHDLGVISQICDSVMVMYRGDLVEKGSAQSIFLNPKENYTKGLIECRPKLDEKIVKLPTIEDFTENKDFVFKTETPEERVQKYEKIYAQKPLIEIKSLQKYFTAHTGLFKKEEIKAVQDISFEIYPGETLGLVGESGSGKTTLSRTLLMLEKPTAGSVWYQGKDITKLSTRELRKLRKEIQIIFQDPYSSLNPMQTVGEIITTPMQIHGIRNSAAERRNQAANLLEIVGLHASDLNKYPHEFSGGQRQRIGIARAVALKPKLIICDESVSALDVSVQAQVLNLLNDLKSDFGLTYLFISHDLSVVKYMSDRLIVLQHGKMQEYGFAEDIYQNPKTQYTRDLIAAIPRV